MTKDNTDDIASLEKRVGKLEQLVAGQRGEWNTVKMLVVVFGLAAFTAFTASALKWYDVSAQVAYIRAKVEVLSERVK